MVDITITKAKGSLPGHTEIIVDSKVYNEDTMYQDVTIDTYISRAMRNQFKDMLRSFGQQ